MTDNRTDKEPVVRVKKVSLQEQMLADALLCVENEKTKIAREKASGSSGQGGDVSPPTSTSRNMQQQQQQQQQQQEDDEGEDRDDRDDDGDIEEIATRSAQLLDLELSKPKESIANIVKKPRERTVRTEEHVFSLDNVEGSTMDLDSVPLGGGGGIEELD